MPFASAVHLAMFSTYNTLGTTFYKISQIFKTLTQMSKPASVQRDACFHIFEYIRVWCRRVKIKKNIKVFDTGQFLCENEFQKHLAFKFSEFAYKFGLQNQYLHRKFYAKNLCSTQKVCHMKVPCEYRKKIQGKQLPGPKNMTNSLFKGFWGL